MDNNSLVHYGVLGMRWGVRRTPAQLARARGERSSSLSSRTNSSSSSSTRKRARDMSDDELKTRINRLELEKKYKDLSRETVSRGRSFATRVVERIGENTLVNLGTQAANHALGSLINKLAGVSSSDSAKRIVNPQKGQTDKK